MSQGASPSNIFNIFPNEVFDLIFSFVDCPADLLSSSLTCKCLSNIAHEHLYYGSLRSDFRRTALWKHLAANPRLSSRVQHLDIVYEGLHEPVHALVPPCVTNEPLVEFGWAKSGVMEDVIGTMIMAIKCMPNLRHFSWGLSKLPPAVFKAIGDHCRQLDGLAFLDTGSTPDDQDTFTDHVDVLSRFRDLRNFFYVNPLAWRGWRHPPLRNGRLKALRELLHERCPSLQELHLEYEILYSHDLPGIFVGAHWPNLKRLRVSAAILQGDHEQFFASHPTIETLQICELDLQFHRFDCSALHNLRSLDIEWIICCRRPEATLDFGGAAQRIVNFSITLCTERKLFPRARQRLDQGPGFPKEWYSLDFLATFTSLRQLVIQSRLHFPDPLQTLLRIVPNTVERIAYRALENPIYFTQQELPGRNPRNPPDKITALAQLVTRLPNLTHLGFIDVPPGVTSTPEAEKIWEVVSIIKTIADVTPKLRFVGIHSGPAPESFESWWIIKRKNGNRFLSCSEVSGNDYGDDIDIHAWGDYNTNLRAVSFKEPKEYWGFNDHLEDD